MARIFPDPPIGNPTREQAEVYAAIRDVPGSRTLAWMALPFSADWRPDWMLLQEDRLCYLLTISPLSLAFPRHSEETGVEKFALQANLQMREFLASCLSGKNLPIYGAIAFPNIAQDDLDALQKRFPKLDVALWGKEMNNGQAIGQILDETPATSPLPSDLVTRLRRKLCPEIVIPPNLIANPRSPGPRTSAAPRLTSHLLDLDQEYFSKRDLLPSTEPGELLASEKIQIVTGAAGTGKSLVLLYRAILLERLRPEARILAITHNRPLCHELQSRTTKILPTTKIHWQTFYNFCGAFHEKRREIISAAQKREFLAEKKAIFPEMESLPIAFVIEEIDWIRDQGFASAETYLATKRHGRKRSLDLEKRIAFLYLLELYREHLDKTAQIDWSGVAEKTWIKIRDGIVQPPLFDSIFIDESQFFAPVWFRIVLSCLEPERGQLFLATDPTQGFLKRQNSWQVAGLQGRGNTVRLRKSYRNSREILDFATAFYQRRLTDEEEEVNLADPDGDLPQGESPLFLHLKAYEDGPSIIIYEILAALDEGANPGSFLVILNGHPVKDFVEKLNRLHGSPVAVDAKEPELQSGRVRVTTLNATTGLESAIVFLYGLDALLARETEADLAEAERMERMRDNTRQIYMAMTRASRRLCVAYHLEQTHRILAGEAAGPH